MSRLPAPGFSRLKAPGFSRNQAVPRPPVQQATSENVQAVFKRPLNVGPPRSTSLPPPRPTNNSVQKDTEPQLTKINAPKRTSYGLSKMPAPSVPVTQHGNSPYNRSKPQSTQIPYVGKKRTTGVLKAPENRISMTQSVQNTTEPRRQSYDVNVEQKSARRQLIPNSSSNMKSKLTRPNSYAGPASKLSGLVQPRVSSNPPPSTNHNISAGQGLSKSLQTLPQAVKPRAIKKRPSLSKGSVQDDMLKSKNLTKQIPRPNSACIPRSASIPVKLGFQASKPISKENFSRPRVSTLSSTLNQTDHMSTPCYTPQSNKKTEILQISPIVIMGDDSETTFDVSHIVTPLKPKELNNNDKLLGEENNNVLCPDGLNITYNPTAMNLTNTHIQEDFRKSNMNDSDAFLNETHVVDGANNNDSKPDTINLHMEIEENLDESRTFLNETHIVQSAENNVLPDNINEVLNKTQVIETNNIPVQVGSNTFLNETQVIETDNSPLNKTHVVYNNNAHNKTQDMSFTESDFIENEVMPIYDKTPLKAENAYCLHTDNISFTDDLKTELKDQLFSEDIEKVISAITSTKGYVSTSEAITISTSQIKEDSFHVDSISVMNDEELLVGSPLADITTTVNDLQNNSAEFNDLNFVDSHYGSVPERVENPPINIEMNTEEDNFQKLKSNSFIQYTPSPTTPTEGHVFNFGAKCNTFSLGVACKSKTGGNFSKLVRRNTYASQDLTSKFRSPKQMNVMETLEGNILMDNTSFLHLSNDVRSMKTHLLKLKRTLLEIDCPSPLIKSPLKRSNSSGMRQIVDNPYYPPLSPRSCLSSPMAVVDPLVCPEDFVSSSTKETGNEKPGDTNKEEEVTTLTHKFHEALRKIKELGKENECWKWREEELEKENECQKYTIKLLQSQLENNEMKEQGILEENIILHEEVSHLTERVQNLTVTLREAALNEHPESYKEGFEASDFNSRKGILQRLYSN